MLAPPPGFLPLEGALHAITAQVLLQLPQGIPCIPASVDCKLFRCGLSMKARHVNGRAGWHNRSLSLLAFTSSRPTPFLPQETLVQPVQANYDHQTQDQGEPQVGGGRMDIDQIVGFRVFFCPLSFWTAGNPYFNDKCTNYFKYLSTLLTSESGLQNEIVFQDTKISQYAIEEKTPK